MPFKLLDKIQTIEAPNCMKNLFRYLKISFFALPLVAAQQDQTTRIVFFGDSITQAGAKPGGYIVKMGEILEKKGLKAKYDLIGAGVSGNKVYDL